MNKEERLHTAIRGDPVDRLPYSFWKHFPKDDESEDSFVRVTLQFARKHELDLVKVMPRANYFVEDWGVRVLPAKDRLTVPAVERYAVERYSDWHKLKRLELSRGKPRTQLSALRRICAELKSTPAIETVFNPISTALKLAGEKLMLSTARTSPDSLDAALNVITESIMEYVRLAQDAGVSGIFFATQCATRKMLSEEEYLKFGKKWDMKVLSECSQLDANLLHVHGDDIMLEMLSDYPVSIVNLDQGGSNPSLAEAARITGKCVLGGVKRDGPIAAEDLAGLHDELEDAIEQLHGRRMIVGPSCSLPVGVSEAALREIVTTARGSGSS